MLLLVVLLLACFVGTATAATETAAGCTLPAPPAGLAYATAKGCAVGDVMPGNCTATKGECSCAVECVKGFAPTGAQPTRRQAATAGVKVKGR